MKETPIGWFYEFEDMLHPNQVNFKEEKQSCFTNLIESLKREINAFRPHFIDQLGHSRKQARILLMQVISTSNAIHNYLTIYHRVNNRHRFTDKMQYFYSQVLTLLEVLLENCGSFDKDMISRLPLTTYTLTNKRMQLRESLDKLRIKIENAEINKELGDLIISGLQLLVTRKELSRSNVQYAISLMERLKSLNPFSTIEIENLLYQYDFNTPTFFKYGVKRCTAQLMDTPSLHEQLEIVIGLEDRVSSLPARGKSRWMAEDESIRKQLSTFLIEKKQYIQQRIELRRLEIQDGKLSDKTDRVQVNLPLAQFGLFIRLFMEKGLLPKEDIGKTFAYYARHFRTPKTPFISAESLQKKSTDVEFSTAKKMKGHLIGMVNWLNEHYNVSNYRDS